MSLLSTVLAEPPARERVAEAALHEDTAQAVAQADRETGLPRVLLIGDSISIGYTLPVRVNLKGVAQVFRPAVNCQDTGFGLAHLQDWLGTGTWDVIHFNFGIWDTHLVDARGALVRSDSQAADGEVRQRHTPEQYRENLSRIVAILKGTGARLIWASTTPIMSRTGERFEAIPTLNRVAAELMASYSIPVNDLYALALPHTDAWQHTDKAHFIALGNRNLGKQVADCIRRALARTPRLPGAPAGPAP